MTGSLFFLIWSEDSGKEGKICQKTNAMTA
jgi:hypothetical protein